MHVIMGLLPDARSTYAGEVDAVFHFILWTAGLVFVFMVGSMVVFAVKYRRREGGPQDREGRTSSAPLQITWGLIALVLALMMFYRGLESHASLVSPPANAYEVAATAKRWRWSFRYHDGNQQEELHCWKGQPFRVVLRSADVLHAFFVPVFRIKVDVVPGRYSTTWFEATEAGEYELLCAEYCGTDHSAMKSKVVVHDTREEFEKWLERAGKKPEDVSNEEWGRQLWASKGCKTCHSIDGTPGQGPSWLEAAELFMHAEKLRHFEQGDPVQLDRAYLEESIQQPKLKVAKGWASGNMPFTKLSTEDRDCLIDFIVSLKGP